ncbi:hypothetical protein 14Stepyanka_00047 [Erwinia phage Stepyanka]|uniref:Uncharacterized protein n=1 Tax=Erwinia phage Stepyanka TaxID=2961688 RepID=A0A9E7NN54_9CAUD|nr:hypothetical protein 14Stepyanka_00047 [Erwinia phage Stepyanka]
MAMLFILTVYACIFAYITRDFRRGVVHHKATLAYWQWGILPRFTVREHNGRFKRNKVGFWYVATH